MEQMEFHWKKEEEKGSFTVSADSLKECVQKAKAEMSKTNASLVDWYSIDDNQQVKYG